MEIKKVVFNDLATIVYWEDETKTIVKCNECDIFDSEKVLAMAIAIKSLGNDKKAFIDILERWRNSDEY